MSDASSIVTNNCQAKVGYIASTGLALVAMYSDNGIAFRNFLSVPSASAFTLIGTDDVVVLIQELHFIDSPVYSELHLSDVGVLIYF